MFIVFIGCRKIFNELIVIAEITYE